MRALAGDSTITSRRSARTRSPEPFSSRSSLPRCPALCPALCSQPASVHVAHRVTYPQVPSAADRVDSTARLPGHTARWEDPRVGRPVRFGRRDRWLPTSSASRASRRRPIIRAPAALLGHERGGKPAPTRPLAAVRACRPRPDRVRAGSGVQPAVRRRAPRAVSAAHRGREWTGPPSRRRVVQSAASRVQVGAEGRADQRPALLGERGAWCRRRARRSATRSPGRATPRRAARDRRAAVPREAHHLPLAAQQTGEVPGARWVRLGGVERQLRHATSVEHPFDCCQPSRAVVTIRAAPGTDQAVGGGRRTAAPSMALQFEAFGLGQVERTAAVEVLADLGHGLQVGRDLRERVAIDAGSCGFAARRSLDLSRSVSSWPKMSTALVASFSESGCGPFFSVVELRDRAIDGRRAVTEPRGELGLHRRRGRWCRAEARVERVLMTRSSRRRPGRSRSRSRRSRRGRRGRGGGRRLRGAGRTAAGAAPGQRDGTANSARRFIDRPPTSASREPPPHVVGARQSPPGP